MPGIRRHRWGLEGYIKVRGKTYTKSFKPGTPAHEIQLWRAQTRARHLEIHPPSAKGTLADDIDKYVQSLNGRARTDAETWLGIWRRQVVPNTRPERTFGDTAREEITRDQLLAAFTIFGQRYEASSLNHLRTYAINVWRYRDGKRHQCPILDIPKFREPAPEPRAVDPALLDKVFEIMKPTQTKARLMLAWATAARPCEIMMIQPHDFHLDDVDAEGRPRPWVFLHGRKSCDDRAVPLNGMGVRGARLFQELNAYGQYSEASVRGTFIRHCEKARLNDFMPLVAGQYKSGRKKWNVTPYVLRHTTLSQLRRKGLDLADVQAIAGHKQIMTTRRYSPTVDEKLVRGMEIIDREVSSSVSHPSERAQEPRAGTTIGTKENGGPDTLGTRAA